MFSIIGTLAIIIIPISFVIALVGSIKSGTFQREMKKQGVLFYIGVLPVIALAILMFAFIVMDKTIQAIVAFVVMFVWGMVFACITEAKKVK